MGNFTTKEQSKQMTKMGFSEKTCDMLYEHTGWVSLDTPTVRWCENIGCHMPCWSLGQLLKLYRATQTFLEGTGYHLAVLTEDNISIEKIISEFEYVYNHVQHLYEIHANVVENYCDFSKVKI